jgi:hypothetical protein
MPNLLFLAFILVAGCQTQHTIARPDVADRAEEVEVLVALLGHEFPSFTNASPAMILNEEFSLDLFAWPHPYRQFRQDLIAKAQESETSPDYLPDARVPADAVRDFCDKNEQREAIWPELGARLPIKLLRNRESREFFKHGQGEKPDGWERFHAAYPGSPGIITISRVGFNQQRDVAVVYLGSGSNWLAGEGNINVFRKKHGKWELQPVFFGPMWVS